MIHGESWWKPSFLDDFPSHKPPFIAENHPDPSQFGTAPLRDVPGRRSQTMGYVRIAGIKGFIKAMELTLLVGAWATPLKND